MATAKQIKPRTLRRDQKADREGGCAGSMLVNDWVKASLMHSVSEYGDVSAYRLTNGSSLSLKSLIRGHQPTMRQSQDLADEEDTVAPRLVVLHLPEITHYRYHVSSCV